MTKTLIIVRHAHALPGYVARVNTDAERPLSEEGFEKARYTATQLAQQNIQPDLIVASPLLRARQTAEVLAQAFNSPIQTATELNGLYGEHEVYDFLWEELQTRDTIIAVGHNPNVSYLTHLLAKEVRPFSPGSFAIFTFTDKNPTLIYFGE
ncbi:MAG: histidine phosphatase family protein [Elusimicrobiaceae bacterium]|nr:histidine phosphatase family protein [Elusimicrobiaceae bacterium]